MLWLSWKRPNVIWKTRALPWGGPDPARYRRDLIKLTSRISIDKTYRYRKGSAPQASGRYCRSVCCQNRRALGMKIQRESKMSGYSRGQFGGVESRGSTLTRLDCLHLIRSKVRWQYLLSTGRAANWMLNMLRIVNISIIYWFNP